MTADMAALEEVWSVLQNSVYVSVIGAFIIMLSAITIASSSKVHANKSMRIAGNLSAAGYAFPGTMLAIGVLSCLGAVDQLLSWTSIYLSGTLFALFFAYLVRFQAVGYGAVSSGLTKIPFNLMSCSRSLGLNAQQTTLRVTIPLIQKPIIAGAVLAFVDIMKELPMTLLLRPFNFETLATYSYQFAHDELMDQASLPALIIIVVGLVPVIFLNKLLRA
jgi:iron(III) transport system permease protein